MVTTVSTQLASKRHVSWIDCHVKAAEDLSGPNKDTSSVNESNVVENHDCRTVVASLI